MTLLDDHSHMLEVRLLKWKSDTFIEFKSWLAFDEQGSGKKLKIFHTNDGREYLCNNFKTFLRNKGIKHHLTIPYTPQNNATWSASTAPSSKLSALSLPRATLTIAGGERSSSVSQMSTTAADTSQLTVTHLFIAGTD